MLQRLLGCTPSDNAWCEYVHTATDGNPSRVECRAYPDTTYYNMRWRGISFQFSENSLHTIDVYNNQRGWEAYPTFPITISWAQGQCQVSISPGTTGTDLVRELGEPTRKGGSNDATSPILGHGPAAWLEWTLQNDLFLLVELSGKEARAPVGWDASIGARPWGVLTLSNRSP